MYFFIEVSLSTLLKVGKIDNLKDFSVHNYFKFFFLEYCRDVQYLTVQWLEILFKHFKIIQLTNWYHKDKLYKPGEGHVS